MIGDSEKLEVKLGFDRVRGMIVGKCSTQYGAKRAQEEVYSTEKDELTRRLDLTDEMRLILMFEESFPDEGFVDCHPFLKPLERETSYIDLLSLVKLRTALTTLKKIVAFFSNIEEGKYPYLKALTGEIVLFPEILRRVDTILDRFGEIKDNASEDLSRIRSSLREKSGAISRKIHSILKKAQSDGIADEDATISVRDGRVLIPVASANKKKINGFIYDESASGKTVFIEPIEIVELNNQVKELQFAEQREILKILSLFTDFLRPYLPELIHSADILGEVDFIRAKGLIALQINAGRPVISEQGELILKDARHPILEIALKKENKPIIPLNLTLTPKKHILLISGPNAGGKSVCLKTVGLLQYMLQWGMLIPASASSEICLFDNIFIDIGDDQSIDNDLSTYSSHLNNMKNMLADAGSNSLILIDEFGSGTEPTAGGAIAEEILSEVEGRGCYGVITTHYTNLKLYAGTSSGVINGAMQFDVQNIQPLFKLEIGMPGNSFAFELARKIGLPENIIKGAETRAGSEFVSIERNLRKIAKNKRALDEKLSKIKSTDKTLENIVDKYQKELGDIQALRKNIIEEARKEAQDILAETNKRIESTIREIRESQAEKEKTKQLRKDLEDFSQDVRQKLKGETDDKIELKMHQLLERKKRQEERKARREKNPPPVQTKRTVSVQDDNTIRVGDKVRVKNSDLIGEVLIVNKNGSLSISVGSIVNKTSLDKVDKISSNQFSKENKSMTSYKSLNSFDSSALNQRRLNFKPQIDIRGQRLDEALNSVSQFIDDAIMVSMSEVKILHGKGNGVLREEIRRFLKTIPGITSFEDEDIRAGGSGITVIKID